MRLAHVRERHAPAGAPWRLAAALRDGRWLDLEVARRTLLAADGRLAHNLPRFRTAVTTLDQHLAAGMRVAALAPIVEPFLADPAHLPRPDSDEAGAADRAGGAGGAAGGASEDLALEPAALRFGPPILRPPSIRDFYAFEQHVRAAWRRRGGEIPEAWYRIPVFYFSNTSELRGPDDPVAAPRGSAELDFELEVAAIVDTAGRDLSPDTAEAIVGGFTIMNDWSARDLQREEVAVRLGPAKGKDFATSLGPWLVTPDELADCRAGKAYALTGSATVNDTEVSRSSWSEIAFGFGEMLARASADVTIRPGEIIGSGTFGTGCLLEVGEERLGRWLEPGDRVTLRVERLGELASPIVARSA